MCRVWNDRIRTSREATNMLLVHMELEKEMWTDKEYWTLQQLIIWLQRTLTIRKCLKAISGSGTGIIIKGNVIPRGQ